MADDRIPTVCTAVVVRDHRGRFLLLERAPDRTFGGSWCFPGGRLRFGEDPVECAARELEEETGVLACLSPYIYLDFDTITSTVQGDVHLVGLVYRCVPVFPEMATNREPDKHSRLGWFSLDDLPAPLMEGTRQWFARSGRR